MGYRRYYYNSSNQNGPVIALFAVPGFFICFFVLISLLSSIYNHTNPPLETRNTAPSQALERP